MIRLRSVARREKNCGLPNRRKNELREPIRRKFWFRPRRAGSPSLLAVTIDEDGWECGADQLCSDERGVLGGADVAADPHRGRYSRVEVPSDENDCGQKGRYNGDWVGGEYDDRQEYERADELGDKSNGQHVRFNSLHIKKNRVGQGPDDYGRATAYRWDERKTT